MSHDPDPRSRSDARTDGDAGGRGGDSRNGGDFRSTVADAGRKARGAWGIARAVVRPLLPKKWTPRSIAIAAVIVIILIVVLVSVVKTVLGILQYVVIGALLLSGLWLIFGRRG
jgi:hypothetical protein